MLRLEMLSAMVDFSLFRFLWLSFSVFYLLYFCLKFSATVRLQVEMQTFRNAQVSRECVCIGIERAGSLYFLFFRSDFSLSQKNDITFVWSCCFAQYAGGCANIAACVRARPSAEKVNMCIGRCSLSFSLSRLACWVGAPNLGRGFYAPNPPRGEHWAIFVLAPFKSKFPVLCMAWRIWRSVDGRREHREALGFDAFLCANFLHL